MNDHTRTEKIGGDSIFIFVVIQVERETVMTAWRLHWGIRELGQYRVICCLSYLFRMLNLSIEIICVVVMPCFVYFTYGISFYYVLIIVVSFIVLLVNKSQSSLLTHSRAFA